MSAKFKLLLNQKRNYCAFIENNKYLNSEIRKHKIKLKIIRVNESNIINLVSNFHKDFTFIAESGISNHEQIKKYNDNGIFNFLIGESLLKSNNISNKIKELKG